MPLQTKEQFADYMHTLLNPLQAHYSAEKAGLSLGDTGATYPPRTMEMEAFSRPLWALVPFWAGGGRDDSFAAIYRAGLAAGSNPASPAYWGGFSDYDQKFVEMAAIACSILLAPETVWNPLTAQEKQNLAAWLDGINHHAIPQCNWQFFRILVNVALQKQGMPYSAAHLEQGLAQIESYYLGDGWYQDGAAPQKDYYISWAIHYYSLIYAKVMEADDHARCALFRQRADTFGKQFVYWFAEDGAALPYGRSMAYRFAQAAFWSACLFAGVTPLSVAQMKGILVRHFAWWQQQRMVDRDGILTIGYSYPNLIMAERYNAPGSPYWGMKTFLVLALPGDHPFWSVQAAPLPPLDDVKTLPAAEMVVQRRKGDVTAYVSGICELPGHGNTPQKYAKFAYSTAFGFSCARENIALAAAAPDSMLAFLWGGMIYPRRASERYWMDGDKVSAVWSPFPGVTVTTTITPTPTGHLRHHQINSTVACTAYDCGFSVARFCKGETQIVSEAGFAGAKNDAHGCTVYARGAGAIGGVLTADPNTNLLHQNTLIPYLQYEIAAGESELLTEIVTEIYR